MISINPALQVRRFVVFSQDGKRAYDETFHTGVNIIRGNNSSGKSTIMNLLFYALGGDYSTWSKVALKCRTVVLEVSINGTVVTLMRAIDTKTLRPMRFFIGNLEDALNHAERGWKQYPYKQTDNAFSFSRIIFDMLGYPEVRSDAGDTNITMHQILRLMYIDQESPTDSLFYYDHFDQPLTREAVSELLLGLYDNDLYELRLHEKKLQALRRDKESEYKGLKRLYQENAEIIDLAKINDKIIHIESSLTQLEKEITIMSQETQYKVSRKKVTSFVENLFSLNILKKDITALKSRVQEIDDDIEDSKLFIESLRNKLDQISDSVLTKQSLGELSLTLCPQCLTPLQPSEQEGVCSLCHQPIGPDANKTYASRIQQEIKMQIAESEKIIEAKESRSRIFKSELSAKVASAEELQRDINLASRNSKPTGQEQLESLFERRGSLKQEMLFLKRQKQIAERYEKLGEDVAEIVKSLEVIRSRIETLESQQSNKRERAMRMIKDVTVSILNNDLPRQKEFQDARSEDVDINFKANSIALDGQFNYSASSNVYLKNAARFAIFLSSLLMPFSRYPKFVFCDNMEDKGMEEERSHNFQRLLVKICSKFPKDSFQMIFSTSMIAPELDSDEYCIGDEYTIEHKALDV